MKNDTYEEFVKEFPGVDEKHYITIRTEAGKFKKLGITGDCPIAEAKAKFINENYFKSKKV